MIITNLSKLVQNKTYTVLFFDRTEDRTCLCKLTYEFAQVHYFFPETAVVLHFDGLFKWRTLPLSSNFNLKNYMIFEEKYFNLIKFIKRIFYIPLNFYLKKEYLNEKKLYRKMMGVAR